MGALKLTYPTHEDYFKNHEETSFLKVVHNREASSPESKNYYAFGMEMPGRTYSGEEYSYGFQGQGKDDENFEGSYDFGARMYDSRLGRFMSVDPLNRFMPFFSPYIFAGNNPIRFVDNRGENPDDAIKLSMEDLGKVEGYEIVFNKETEKTIIHKTSIVFNERSILTENAVTYTLEETTIVLDGNGNIESTVTTETDISVVVEETTNVFSKIDYELLENDVLSTKNVKSGTVKYDPFAVIEEVSKDEIVKSTQKLIKGGKELLKYGGEGLPYLSFSNIKDNNLANVAKVLATLFLDETFGAEELLFSEESKGKYTSMNVPLGEEKDYSKGIDKVFNKTKVIEN